MIEQVMYFLLGMLVAVLAVIALLPALWRRAVRLTRAKLEATLPLTPEEIGAEKGRLRASHAVDIRRIELERDATETALQAAKTEIGTQLTVIQAHESTMASQAASIEALRQDGDEKRAHIATLDETIARLETERDNLATNLSASRISNQALDQQALNLRQVAEQNQARMDELHAQVETLNARLADSLTVTTQLRDDVQTKGDELRQAARKLREAASHIAQVDRRLAAMETLAQDRQDTIDSLQAERLQMIEDAGVLTRERDHERLERQAMASQIDHLTSRLMDSTSTADAQSTELRRSLENLSAERMSLLDERMQLTRERDSERSERQMLAAQLAGVRSQAENTSLAAQNNTANHLKVTEELRLERARLQEDLASETAARAKLEEAAQKAQADQQDVIRDLTRTIEGLKRDHRRSEEELSALRLERLAAEQEILRLRRVLQLPEKGEGSPPPRQIVLPQPGETAP